MLDFVNLLLKHVWAIVLITGVCVVAMIEPAVTGKRTYTADATFINQSRRGTSAISGVASQLGLNLSPSDAPSSPQFYADLLASTEILEPVAGMQYRFRTDTGMAKGTLADAYGIHGGTHEDRIERAVDILKRSVTADASAKTGVVTLTVKGPQPGLVRDISLYILNQLNEFNLRNRQAQAARERQFAEGRLEEAASELRVAENRLQDFREKNRFVTGATRLETDQDRLVRQVAMRQQVYVTLAQTYEQARIDELRAFPVLSVIQEPRSPLHPNPRGLGKRGVLALAIGVFLGTLFALLREYFARLAVLDQEAVVEFSTLRKKILNDLKHPFSFGRRSRSVGTRQD